VIMEENYAVIVKNLSKTYSKGERRLSLKSIVNGKFSESAALPKLKALNNINFKVKKGSFYGIIGSNGSGKSTLLRILLGSIKPDKGSFVKLNGNALKLSMGMGFNNQLTARDNIYINGSIIGMSFKEIGDNFESILSFAGVEEFADVPIKNYSSGMKSRLQFAIAMKAKADILLLDEFFGGVGDEEFRAKSEAAFEEMLFKGKTIILVSHSLNLVQKNCERVLLINKGEQLAEGKPDEVIDTYNEIVSNKLKRTNEL